MTTGQASERRGTERRCVEGRWRSGPNRPVFAYGVTSVFAGTGVRKSGGSRSLRRMSRPPPSRSALPSLDLPLIPGTPPCVTAADGNNNQHAFEFTTLARLLTDIDARLPRPDPDFPCRSRPPPSVIGPYYSITHYYIAREPKRDGRVAEFDFRFYVSRARR